MLIHDGGWLAAERIHSMLQQSVHIAISELRLKKSNQSEIALMALVIMMLALEQNILAIVTKQPSKT